MGHIDYAAFLGGMTLVCGLFVLAGRLGRDAAWLHHRVCGAAVSFSRMLFPVFLLVFLLRSFLFEPFRIPSASMMPTLLVGDFILVTKYNYGLRMPLTNTRLLGDREPQRGDVVVFRYPEDPGESYIKRVVGLPGDQLHYRDKKLYINDQLVAALPKGRFYSSASGRSMNGVEIWEEELAGINHEILLNPSRRSRDVEIVVPERAYFVLGDNRDNSRDSRVWGFVPDQLLVGKALLVWLNWDRGVAWRRIGKLI